MSKIFSISAKKEKSNQWQFWIISLSLIVGLILSFFSWLEICVEHCSANQEYRLFGLPFAITGTSFFLLLISVHFLSHRYPSFSRLFGWLIASALGAELMFIAVQQYEIGHWCPVCLSIATTVFIAAAVLLTGYFQGFKETIQHHNRGEMMQKIKQALASVSFFVLGFLMAFIGVSKPDFAEAAMNEMRDKMAFGTKNSPVEVYFITDWYCPSCRKVEPLIEKIYPQIKSNVTFYFIDFPIHKKSLNFSPYNLSFLVNNKAQYFKTRDLLSRLSDKTESPKEEDVIKISGKSGISYHPLSFLEVKSGLEFFDLVVDKYKLHATPTIIVTNPSRDTVVKFEGRDEISEEKVLNAIKKMTPSK